MNNLLIIFTKNPIEGKVKTRLAASIGTKNAVEVYKKLIQHTQKITATINCEKQLYYGDFINIKDDWNNAIYKKKLQFGYDLGARMQNAFENGLEENFTKIVIIGTDLWELTEEDITMAFESLNDFDACIGPAEDGGYYLLGFKNKIPKGVFENKKWSTHSVFKDTMKDLKSLAVKILDEKNDIDEIEDIKNNREFEKYLGKKNKYF
jgi:uncharacterized protein